MKNCTLFNYADDDTLFYAHSNLDQLVKCITEDTQTAVNWFIKNGMKANPDKFQAIVSHRSLSPNVTFHISGSSIKTTECVTLLGIKIDRKLTFTEHIHSLCRKAGKQLNVLKRMSNTLSHSNKMLIFNTFILSNFNYCPLIWNFCSKSCVLMMEKIQERAIRFVLKDNISDYTTLLSKCKRKTLQHYRSDKIAIQVYKSLHNISPSYVNDIFCEKHMNYNVRKSSVLI